MSGGELRWCAGAVAQAYAAIGGRVVQAGRKWGQWLDLILMQKILT